jgi:hypothetical protein
MLTGFGVINVKVILILLGLFLLGEVLDYALVLFGAKKMGASSRAVFGAFLGGLAGAVLGTFFFGIGILFGTFAGIFAGAFLVEFFSQKGLKKSLKAGTGSLAGAVVSVFFKSLLALGMIALITVRIFSAQA